MRRALIAALLVAAAAAAVYMRDLDRAPLYLQHDEVNFSIQAHAVATTGRDVDGHRWPLYFSEPSFSIGRDPIYIYAAAAALSFLPPVESTLRLPSTIAVVITIFLVVLIGHELFGSVLAGVVAGLLLATSPALFMHGRKALSVIFPLPFIAWWLLFILRYERTSRARDLLASVVGLGFAIYSYLAMVVLVPVYALITVGVVISRKQWRHVGLLAAALLVAVAPIAYWQFTHPTRVTQIVGMYGLYSPTLNVLQGAKDLLSWFSISTRVDVYWQIFNPGLLLFSGESVLTDSTRLAGHFPFAFIALLPLGLVFLFRKPMTLRSAIIVALLVTAPLPAVLVVMVSLYRFLVILIFAALIATAGFMFLWSKPQIWWKAAAIASLVSALWMFRTFHGYYVTEWPSVSAVWFGGNIKGAVEAITKAPPSTTTGKVYLSARVPYLDRYFELYRRLDGRDDLAASPRSLDLERDDWRDAPAGSTAIVSANDTQSIGKLTEASWQRSREFQTPDGHASFLLLTSPQ